MSSFTGTGGFMSMRTGRSDNLVFLSASPDEKTSTSVKPKITEPELYWVVMLNDDFTPMEFVVDILMRFFDKNPVDATEIMLSIHNNGRARVASYVYDIAVTKVSQVHEVARQLKFPLRCTIEPA